MSEVGFICLPHMFNPFSKLGANLGRALQPTTKNAVYAVRCRACHKLYVGETRHEISLRIKQHLYRINSGDGTSVLYLHFKLHGPENLQSLVLESSGSWTTAQRRAAERRWIHRLKTIDPTGVNEKHQCPRLNLAGLRGNDHPTKTLLSLVIQLGSNFGLLRPAAGFYSIIATEQMRQEMMPNQPRESGIAQNNGVIEDHEGESLPVWLWARASH
ncbi:hypothetical protein NQZ68_013042 [Dissostichus eleginoides]|nr:hypothetical protein NQZ68_013042 [Dissostichus eleginoides]